MLGSEAGPATRTEFVMPLKAVSASRSFRRRFLCSCALAILPGAVAQAADLGRPAPEVPSAVVMAPMANYRNWTGLYVGGNFGGQWATFDGRLSETGSSVIGGLQLGYNLQQDAIVVGVEGDVALTHASVSDPTAIGRVNVLSTIRGRVGFAIDRFLPYGTLGVGLTSATLETPVSRERKLLTGLVVGGGLEYALAPNWSVRGEYLFVAGPKREFTPVDSLGVDGHLVRGGVNYKF